MTDYVPAPLPICGAAAALPAPLYEAARSLLPGAPADPLDVDTDLRCVLQAHVRGDHQALVRELPGVDTGSAWTTWDPRGGPAELLVRADCSASGTDEVCCSYDAHPGAHTFELTDPWSPSLTL